MSNAEYGTIIGADVTNSVLEQAHVPFPPREVIMDPRLGSPVVYEPAATDIWVAPDNDAVVALNHMDTGDQEAAPQPVTLNATSWPGDLAHYEHSTNVFIVNRALQQYREHRGETLTQEEQTEQKRLERGVDDYRAAVNELYPNTAEHPDPIAERYKQADKEVGPDATMEARIEARVAAANGVRLAFDYDNTISDSSKRAAIFDPNGDPEADHQRQLIAGSEVGEAILTQYGRDEFAHAFVQSWQRPLTDMPGAFYQAGTLVPTREGMDRLFTYLRDEGIGAGVISANFEPIIRGGLSQLPDTEGVSVRAITAGNINSTAKDAVIRDEAHKYQDKAFIFVGDGASDLPALDAQAVVACYFALEGSVFATQLAEQGIPHFTYKTGDDIIDKLAGITPAQEEAAA